jgi:membrane-associated phospholipid phosphatase
MSAPRTRSCAWASAPEALRALDQRPLLAARASWYRSAAERSVPAGALCGLAGGLALSRVYLGVHHPSDVLGGALLGTEIALPGAR